MQSCFISTGHETRVATTSSGSEKFKGQEGSNGRRPYNRAESKQTTPDQAGRVGARECQPEDGSPGQQTTTGESFSICLPRWSLPVSVNKGQEIWQNAGLAEADPGFSIGGGVNPPEGGANI